MSIDEVVELFSVIIGPPNAIPFGRKWLELNGRHYIMKQIFQNARLDHRSVPEIVNEIVEEKEKVWDEESLQKHLLLFDYLVHFYKTPEKWKMDPLHSLGTS